MKQRKAKRLSKILVSEDEKYLSITDDQLIEEVKEEIMDLEISAEILSNHLTVKYKQRFECENKTNLRIWVARDIDGTESEEITMLDCLEKEYRSQIAIDYLGPKYDEDFYADSIYLWHYSGSSRRSIGGLYDREKFTLEKDIEAKLEKLLETFNDYGAEKS